MDNITAEIIERKSIMRPKNSWPIEIAETSFKQYYPPGKASEYDFCDARKLLDYPNTYASNSLCESVAHMLNILFGGGIFAMHVAFYNIGITSAIIGLVVLAVLVGISMSSLIDSVHKMYRQMEVPQMSYPDLVEAAVIISPWRKCHKYSRAIRYFVEFILVFHLLGSCVVYHVFIAKNLKQLLEGGDHEFNTIKTAVNVYTLGLSVPLLAIIMVRNLKYLAPFTVAINLYANMAALVVIFYGLRGEISIDLIPTVKSIAGLFKFIGMCLFCLAVISVSLPIENNMASPQNFKCVVAGSLSYATTIMMIIGIFGYWGYGHKGTAPITVHFPWTHFPIMTKMFLCITIYVTYAEIFYFGFDIQWYYLKRLHAVSKWWLWERLYRAVNVVILSLIACGIPNVCSFMAFLGCFCVSIISFIFPAFIKLVLDWPIVGRCRWNILQFTLIFTFALILITIGSFYNLRDVFLIK